MSDEYEEQMAALRGQFIDQLSADAAELAALSAAGDVSAIGAAAHRIAGMAAVFGFDDLTRLGKLADRAARSGEDTEAIPAFVAAVQAAFAAG